MGIWKELNKIYKEEQLLEMVLPIAAVMEFDKHLF